jgi:hypothetical protein
VKYDPLKWHLAKIKADEWQPSFSELERILGFTLPRSAYHYKEWWGNKKKGHAQTEAWMGAGWDVHSVDIVAKKAKFVRGIATPGSTRSRRTNSSSIAIAKEKSTPHTWDTETTHTCELKMSWVPLGRVIIGEDGRLEFPVADKSPGLYRIQVKAGAKRQVYVGEAVNLKRRFGNYRHPGGNQKTSIRINKTLKDALKDGAEVNVAIATYAARSPKAGSAPTAVDLSLKPERRLFENLAQVMGGAIEIESLNR